MAFDEIKVAGCKAGTTSGGGSTADQPCDTDIPSVDTRCADPAFRKAFPHLCVGFPRLTIKPSVVSICQLESRTFRAFLYANSVETEITTGLTWYSSNQGVIVVGGNTGKATGLTEGIANISVAWQDLSATAQVTVLPGDCCNDTKVGMAVVVDNSLSMSMGFNAQYPTKLAYAKALAYRFVSELNTAKDLAAVLKFSDAGVVATDLTNVVQTLKNAVTGIANSQNRTNIADGLRDAIDLLDADTTLTRKVVVLLSDLENKEGEDPVPIAQAFEEAGNVVVVVGIRAFGDGFDLGNQMASGGFFLNAHRDSYKATFDALSGLKGYLCAGNCVPPGDIIINKAKLQYFGFANWNVTQGAVDLIGGTPPYDLYDLLPGNGLYVDMVGSAPWPLPPDPSGTWLGKLESKVSFAFQSATTYRLTFKLAGNQRQSVAETPYHHRIRVVVEGFVNDVIEVSDWLQDFTDYTYEFTTNEGTSGKISFETISHDESAPAFGLLLDDIALIKDPEGTPEIIFEDNFDTENSVYIPPVCGPSFILGYGYGYDCYGYGCLTTPPDAQTEDPLPQPDVIEGASVGFTPPAESGGFFNPAGMFPTISYFDQRLQAILDQANAYTDAQLEGYLPLAGGEMTGFITLHATPEEPMHAATKAYVDAAAGGTFDDFVDVIGDTMTGDLVMEDARIGFSPGVGTDPDAFLSRISANSLGLVSGADPQSFHIYRLETTSPAATERISIGWSGVQAYVTTEATGAGGQRDLVLNGQLNLSDGLIVAISDLAFDGVGIVGLYVNQLTAVQRDALSIGAGANGGIIFNSTTDKYQGLIDGDWVDFATGTISYPVTSVNGQTGDVDLDDEYVSLTGDSMTGLLSIAPSANTAALTLTGFTPAAGSGSAAPAVLNVTGGVGGTSAVFAGGQGGNINLTAGAGGDSTSGFDAGGIGGSIFLTPGAGGSGPMGTGSAGAVVINGNLQATGAATFLDVLNGSYLSLNNPPANTRSIYISGHSVTGANTTEILYMAGTWNTTGAPKAIYLNITDTASAASGSYLMDLGVGGGSYVSKWWVDKFGKTRQTSTLAIAMSPTDTSAMTVTGYSLTGSNAQSLLDISGTWNTSGTPTLIKANVTDTASNAASRLLDLQVGGVSFFAIRKDGSIGLGNGHAMTASIVGIHGGNGGSIHVGAPSGNVYLGITNVFGGTMLVGLGAGGAKLGSGSVYSWSSDSTSYGAADVILARDAANTLALRNGVNAQAFRVYNTYTDASNYERGFIRYSTGSGVAALDIGTEQAGTGTARPLQFVVQGAYILKLGTNGHLLWNTDNTYDIGASGATRPRNVYTGGFVSASGEVASQVGFNSISTGYYWFNGRLIIRSPSDGVVRFTNNAADGFTELQLYTDVILARDAANILALRNSTNAQAFRVYGTFTDLSNYERLTLSYNSGAGRFQIDTENAGTGTARGLRLNAAGGSLQFALAGTSVWQITGNHLIASADNLYDIGASGATRPRSIYVGTSATVGAVVIDGLGLFNAAYLTLTTTGTLGWSDVFLVRDGAANTLAMRNSTAAQTFNIYNTYTDASNYERLQIGWSSNTLNIRAQAAGTGTVRNVQLAGTWTFGSTGMLFPSADNLYDIGISGTFRVRNAYLAGTITVSQVAASFINLDSQFYIDGGGADGVGVFYNQAFTSFGRICLGGLTNAFPAIKRNGAGIDFRVADDTNYARITALDLILTKGTLTDPSLVIDSTVTWNDVTDTFTAWKLNVTNTASAAASALLDLQVGGASVFTVFKTPGNVAFGGVSTGPAFASTAGVTTIGRSNGGGGLSGGTEVLEWAQNNNVIGTRGPLFIGTTYASRDVILDRDAAAVLALRNSTNAQTLNIYGTYTDASNYERLYLKGVASASFEIGTIKAGTGTARSLLLNPETGIVQLMGTSNAFPAFKRNSTSIEIRLADDSGYANLRAEYLHCFGLTVDDNGAAPALGGSSPSFSDYYGTDGKALADPDIWITVNVDGTNRRIPCYNA